MVNVNQIRLIIRAVKEKLPEIFPNRFSAPSPLERAGGEVFEVPKDGPSSRSDSHADDIIDIVREEFAGKRK